MTQRPIESANYRLEPGQFVDGVLSLDKAEKETVVPLISHAQAAILKEALASPDAAGALGDFIVAENDPLACSHVAYILELHTPEPWKKEALLDLSDAFLTEAVDREEGALRRRHNINLAQRLNTLVADNHDFLKAASYLESCWAGDDLVYFPETDTAYAFLVPALQTYAELNDLGRCQALLQALEDGRIPLKQKTQRFSVLTAIGLYVARFQPEDLIDYLTALEKAMVNYQSDLSAEDERDLMHTPLAFLQAEVLMAWDKHDPRYEDEKQNFLRGWRDNGIDDLSMASLQAKVLVSEGKALKNRLKLEAAVELYADANLDFHVAETELVILDLFFADLSLTERDNLLFSCWSVLERKLGGRAVAVFLENLNRAREQAGATRAQMFGETQEFKPLKGIPNHINILAKNIFNHFVTPEDTNVIETLQRGLELFTHHVAQVGKSTLEDKRAYLLETLEQHPAATWEEILAVLYEGCELSAVPFELIDSYVDAVFRETARQAVIEQQPRQQEKAACLHPTRGVELCRQVLFFPDVKNKRLHLVKIKKDEPVSESETKLVSGLLNSESPGELKITRSILQPQIHSTRWIANEDFPDRYRGDVEMIYVLKFAAPPNPDEGYWVTMLDAKEELLVASAVAPYQFGMPPDLFTGCRNKAAFESVIYEALIKKGFDPPQEGSIIQKSVDMGTFAPRPPLDTAQAPVAVRFAAQESHKTWCSEYIIMLGHIMIMRSLRQAGIGFAESVFPADKILSTQARDERMKKEKGMTTESLTNVKENYIDNKVLNPKVLVVPIAPLLS